MKKKSKIIYIKEMLASAFWLLPSCLFFILIALAFVVEAFSDQVQALLPIKRGSADGARMVLSSIATGVMTVLGVTFSITIVILQQVSQQYSPRVIENFIRSKASQFTLGIYAGTFGYSIVLLQTLQEEGENQGPFQLGPTLAIGLAILCLGMLIFLLHLLAKSIKSNHIVAGIAQESISAIDAIERDLQNYHCPVVQAIAQEHLPFESIIIASHNGFLQAVIWTDIHSHFEGLWAAEILITAGDFIHIGQPLMQLRHQKPLRLKSEKKLAKLFVIDLVRTHTQDLRFGIRELADIGLKALSPGINDPTTAVEALDQIGTILLHFTHHSVHSRTVIYPDGSVLALKHFSYREYLDLCFNEIAIAGKGFYSVQLRIQKILDHIHSVTRDPGRREILEQKILSFRPWLDRVPGRELFSNRE